MSANYNYRIDDQNVILSADEHKQVQDLIQQGRTMIHLRGGKLIVNPMFIRYVKETDTATIVQEQQHMAKLELNATNGLPQLTTTKKEEGVPKERYLKELHFPYYEKMGWEHGPNCVCKEGWEERDKEKNRYGRK